LYTSFAEGGSASIPGAGWLWTAKTITHDIFTHIQV
jgi:hypothetical protein